MTVHFTCSIDDGHPSDLKTAELLARHGLPGTFYVPLANCEGFDVMTPAQIREIAGAFEIGSHTLSHCRLKDMNSRESYFQIEKGKKELENLIGREVSGFCYPGGKYTKREVEFVRACGFQYARTTVNLCFDAGEKIFEIPTTVQFYPHRRKVYLANFASARQWNNRMDGLRVALRHGDWIARLFALFEYARENGKLFHLWAHSRDIDLLDAWEEFDGFLAHVAAHVSLQDRLTNQELAGRLASLKPQLATM